MQDLTSSEGKAFPLFRGRLPASCCPGIDGELASTTPISFTDSPEPDDACLVLRLTRGCSSTSPASSWMEELPLINLNQLNKYTIKWWKGKIELQVYNLKPKTESILLNQWPWDVPPIWEFQVPKMHLSWFRSFRFWCSGPTLLMQCLLLLRCLNLFTLNPMKRLLYENKILTKYSTTNLQGQRNCFCKLSILLHMRLIRWRARIT